MSTSETIQTSYTVKQEIIHSLIHVVGILVGIAGLVFLITHHAEGGSVKGFEARLIYCVCFVITFLSSALYHAIQEPGLKNLFRILDHISIYLLIAGTYTPIIVLYMNNEEGIRILWIVWSAALVGIILKIFFVDRAQVLSVCFYLLLGLFFLFDARHFFAALPFDIAWLVVAGAILYVSGVTFYLWKGFRYHHAIWHVFTLAASLCHFAAVFK